MQTKLYTMKFSHHPVANSQPVPEQQLQNPDIADFTNFRKFPKKTELPEKFELPGKRGFQLTATRRTDSYPPTPFIN